MAERVPVSLLAALADLVKWLEAAQIPAVVIGGVASSLLGRPRLTQDIDALAIMPESEWETAIGTAQHFGITLSDLLDGFARILQRLRGKRPDPKPRPE